MAITIQGYGGNAAEVDGTGFRALRVNARPVDYGFIGRYRNAAYSGTMSAGLGAGAIWCLSCGSSAAATSRLRLPAIVVHLVRLDGLSGSATAFAAGFGSLRLIVGRPWSVPGTGGATQTQNKLASRMAAGYGLGAFTAGATAGVNISNTGLINTTATTDNQPLAIIPMTFSTAPSVQVVGVTTLYTDAAENGCPLVLAGEELHQTSSRNEIVTLYQTVPATGTWRFGVTCEWSEVMAY